MNYSRERVYTLTNKVFKCHLKAYDWYFNKKLKSLGNITPSKAVNQGRGSEVLDILYKIDEGVF